MLVNTAALLAHAEEKSYIVMGLDTCCFEIIPINITTAEEEQSPLIFQTGTFVLERIGIDRFVDTARALIQRCTVPVSIHLDHATSIETIYECIRKGFTSVMFDGSLLPFEKNIELTRKVAERAHERDVTVEAELGRVVGTEEEVSVEERDAVYTDPNLAIEFVEKTGVDCLAVSVGTVHGHYKGEPRIDYNRLESIYRAVGIPLVLHGGSGLGPEVIDKVRRMGVRKINIGTVIKEIFTAGTRRIKDLRADETEAHKIIEQTGLKVSEELKKLFRMFGSSHKNWTLV